MTGGARRGGVALKFDDDGNVVGHKKNPFNDDTLPPQDCLGVRCELLDTFAEFIEADGMVTKMACAYAGRSPFDIFQNDGVCPLLRWYTQKHPGAEELKRAQRIYDELTATKIKRMCEEDMVLDGSQDLLVRHGNDGGLPPTECDDSAGGPD